MQHLQIIIIWENTNKHMRVKASATPSITFQNVNMEIHVCSYINKHHFVHMMDDAPDHLVNIGTDMDAWKRTGSLQIISWREEWLMQKKNIIQRMKKYEGWT